MVGRFCEEGRMQLCRCVYQSCYEGCYESRYEGCSESRTRLELQSGPELISLEIR